jgi:hypothetical protein
VERFKITDMEGSEQILIPTEGDRMRARRKVRAEFGSDAAVGDLYLFAAFETAKRLDLTKLESAEEWADTIHSVEVAFDVEDDRSSAEGEGGATPAS